MSNPTNPLLVPIDLDVMLVNPGLLNANTYRWWQYNYTNQNNNTFTSPEPDAFNNGVDNPVSTGAYLHWNLPLAHRTAKQGTSGDFPLVPNRWLIVRVCRTETTGNVQKAWVLESDCPSTVQAGNSSYFLIDNTVANGWKQSNDPKRKTAATQVISTQEPNVFTTNIGASFDLSSWQETSPGNMFLTAIAAGNSEFCAYVPHNQNVFSFYDDLSDAPQPATISYFVTGWYSDLTNDIVTITPDNYKGNNNFTAILDALNWTLQNAGSATPPDSSLYSGMVFGLNWNNNTNPPTPEEDQLEALKSTENVTIAIGNTGVDAFSTLTSALVNLPDMDSNTIIEMLRAFQYDMLPMLNEVNGDALLNEKIRDRWFSSKPGGTRWVIVNADGSSDTSTSAVDEPAWLITLNNNQALLDAATQTLHSLQWDLFSTWWKYNYITAAYRVPPDQTNVTPQQLLDLLDSTKSGNLVTPVLNQLQYIQTQQQLVPIPDYTNTTNAQDAYLAGVANFATKNGIASGKILKAQAQPRFWKVNNPNVVISGVDVNSISNPNDSLSVRSINQLITAFTVDGKQANATTIGSVIPSLPNMQAVPSSVQNLFNEFILLDVSNAQQIATALNVSLSDVNTIMQSQTASAYNNILPSNANALLEKQIWNPMYIEWQVSYVPIPYEYIPDSSTGARVGNWYFDGTDYQLAGSPVGVQPQASIGGRSLLSPHLKFTFGDRLLDFINKYKGSEQQLQELYDAVEKIDDWKFLSQELCYLNDYTIQRQALAFSKPHSETLTANATSFQLQQLMGFGNDSAGNNQNYNTPENYQGLIANAPAVTYSSSSLYPFQGIRSGQFYISKLIFYDKFGRVFDLVDSAGQSGVYANNFPLVVDAPMAVSNNLQPQISHPFQLVPRLMQDARLNMLLIDQANPQNVLGYAANVNPVSGWIVSNHLDNSLSIYLPDGTDAGEIRLIQSSPNIKTVKWFPPIHSTTINSINDIAAISPNLGSFITSIQTQSESAFTTFISAIDETLWTTDPLGAKSNPLMSVLMGRPLALVNLKLQFQLEGNPVRACDWPSPVSPAPEIEGVPDYTTSQFSIRFGDIATREDGVIGYFKNENFGVFNSVAQPVAQQTFVTQIGPFNTTNGNYINLPFDGNTSQLLTLLVDPRGSISATTGILPAKKINLPAQFIDDALSNMEITFKTGPLLTRKQAAQSANDIKLPFPDSVSFLPIAEQGGTWSWWENTLLNAGTPTESETWQGYNIEKASSDATLDANLITITEGYLQFISNQNSKPNN